MNAILFPIGWLPYSPRCSSTCWDRHFLVPNGIMRCPSHVIPGCLLSCPTFWELNGLVFTLVTSFFGESLTWTWFCFLSSRHSLRYCASTSLFMHKSRGRHLGISSSYHTSISSSAQFCTTLWTCLGLSHLIVAHLSWCQCGHTIDDLCTHLLWCPCGSECIVAHDTFWDTIATIILENGTHVQREVSHLFPHHTQQRVDILITRNGFHILMDIVIVDLTRIDMV